MGGQCEIEGLKKEFEECGSEGEDGSVDLVAFERN